MFPGKPWSSAMMMMLLSAVLLLLASGACNLFVFEPRSAVDLAPFKELARAGGCSDIRNRLLLIDDRLVFWDIAGNCADAAYSETLYGSTPDQILCVSHDSIAGPVKDCRDKQYQDLFDTIIANLDRPDLGLGTEHTVQPVPIWFLFW